MKALKWLVILLLLIVVLAALYLLLPHKPKTPTGASLLPADTFVFVQMPDVPGAKAGFRTTALWQIWHEKEVQEFIGKTRDTVKKAYDEHLADNPYMSLVRRGASLAQGEMFLAVPEFNAVQKEVPSVVLGMNVKEHKAEAEQWLADVKAKLKAEVPKFSEDSQAHLGVAYKRWTTSGTTLCQAWFGSLLIVTSKEETMKDLIARHNDAAAPSLAKDPRFEHARQKMPSAHALLVYSNPKPLVAMLKGFALFMPQLQSSMRTLDAMQAVSYSTTFVNGSFQDVIFVDAPADKRGDLGSESVPTEKKTLPLTSESSLFYSVQSADLGKAWDTMWQQLQNSSLPKLGEALSALDKFNRDNSLNLPKDLLDALGPEYAISLSWETNAPLPELFVAMQVRDKAKATASLDKLWNFGKAAAKPTGMDPFADLAYNGQTIHALQTPIVSPSYAVTEKFLLIALQTDTTKKLIDKQTNPGKSLADNPLYQRTMAALPAGGNSYAYLDTSNLFTRTYVMLQALANQYKSEAAMVQDYIDLKKMPQTQTIARHLQPSASAQVVDKDGFTTIIVSPIGMPALMTGAMVGAGVAVAQHFPNFPMK